MNFLYVSLLFFVLSFSCPIVNSDDKNAENAESDLDRMASELEQLAEKNLDEEESRSKVIKKLGSIKKLIGKVELNHGATKKLGKVFKTVFGDEEIAESLKKPETEENVKQTVELIKMKLDKQPELKEQVKSVFKHKTEGKKFMDKLGKFGKFIARAGKWIFRVIKRLFKISVFMTKFLINLAIRVVGEVVGIALFLPIFYLFLVTAASMPAGKALCFVMELIGHSLDIVDGPFSKYGDLHFLQFDLGVVHGPGNEYLYY